MSTDLKVSQSTVHLTSFYGGQERGRCIQLTQQQRYRHETGGFIWVDVASLPALINDLQKIVDGTEEPEE